MTSFSEALRGDLSLQELFRRENQGRQGWLCLSNKLNPSLAFQSLIDLMRLSRMMRIQEKM